MVSRTDPAKEIVDFFQNLDGESTKSGDTYIAEKLNLEPWSRDFFETLFSVKDRIETVRALLSSIDLDEDQLEAANNHLNQVSKILTKQMLSQPWRASNSIIAQGHVNAINMLSYSVRQKVSYPKLDKDEIAALLINIENLLSWLQQHQLSEQDFIRQALIEGLQLLKSRLSGTGMLGWGYTLSSLHDVIAAYMALERGFPDPEMSNSTAAAILKKTGDLIESLWKAVGHAQEFKDRGELVLQIYGAVAVVKDSGIAGYLANSG